MSSSSETEESSELDKDPEAKLALFQETFMDRKERILMVTTKLKKNTCVSGRAEMGVTDLQRKGGKSEKKYQ